MSSPVHVITLPAASPVPLMFSIALYPLGTLSSTDIPVASLGPSLDTVIVNVITSPTLGSASLTTFTKLISTAGLNPKSTVMLPSSSEAAS